MAIPFTNVPVPQQQGTVGAAVDVSALPPILTLASFSKDPNGVLQLEQSFEATGGPPPSVFTPVASWAEAPYSAALEVEGNFVRIRRVSCTSVGAAGVNVQVAGQSGTGAAAHVGPLAVPASGPSPSGDISAEPPNLVATFSGADPSAVVQVEHSFDGANWAPVPGGGQLVNGSALQFISGANDIRGNRQQPGLQGGSLDVWGVPSKSA